MSKQTKANTIMTKQANSAKRDTSNTKRVAKAASNAKQAAASTSDTKRKRSASAAATKLDTSITTNTAAIIRKHFNTTYNTAQRMKTARALLRAHAVERSEAKIVEFFTAHIAKRNAVA